MLVGAVERVGKVRLEVAQKPPTKQILRAFIKAKLADETRVICPDQHQGYQGVGDHDTIHVTIDHSKGEYVRGVTQTRWKRVEFIQAVYRWIVSSSFNETS